MNAMTLIATVKTAIENNISHYDKNGKKLKNIADIIKTLTDDTEILVDQRKPYQNTTYEEQRVYIQKLYDSGSEELSKLLKIAGRVKVHSNVILTE